MNLLNPLASKTLKPLQPIFARLRPLFCFPNLVYFKISRPNEIGTDQPIGETKNYLSGHNHSLHWFLEIAGLVMIMLFLEGGSTPNVNESHYLTKAKSFWSPEWCSGDLFLASSDAHIPFFVLFGWLTNFVSLATFAWIGRIGTWIVFAIAWMHLGRSIGFRKGVAFVSCLLFLVTLERFHMAGEWVVGGFEGKSVAYAFVIFSLSFYVSDRFIPTIFCLAIASSMHVVVGAWVAVAMLIGVFRSHWMRRNLFTRPTPVTMVALACFGSALIAATGVIPPLLNNVGTSRIDQFRAAEVIVHSRLAHHQLFNEFPAELVVRFFALVGLWWVASRLVVENIVLSRLNCFCLGSLIIAMGGVVLSTLSTNSVEFANQLRQELDVVGAVSTKLLTLYWFRLADFAVPLALSLLCCWFWSEKLWNSADKRKRGLAAAFITLLTLAGAILATEKGLERRSGADMASLPGYEEDPRRTWETAENWKAMCEWVRNNTPSDAVFVTPDKQQTFKWFAQRAEVVSWKDVPQDTASIIEWHARVQEFIIPQRRNGGILAYTDNQLVELCQKYGANYLVIPQVDVDLAQSATGFPSSGKIRQVYPLQRSARKTYCVFEVSTE